MTLLCACGPIHFFIRVSRFACLLAYVTVQYSIVYGTIDTVVLLYSTVEEVLYERTHNDKYYGSTCTVLVLVVLLYGS